MSTKNKLVSIALAAAALSLASIPVTSTLADAHTKMVKCYGVNHCKGHSKCKTAKNACKGQNSCKGTGFMKMSPKKCEKMGGSTEEK
jgi:uncharacterized membrane protein